MSEDRQYGLDVLIESTPSREHVPLREYQVTNLEVTPDLPSRIATIDSYAHCALPDFLRRVANDLECSISVYSLNDDAFHRILATDDDLSYEVVPMSKSRVMQAMIKERPGVYIAELGSEWDRGGSQYVGAHIIPSARRRLTDDYETDKPHLILNVMPREGKEIGPSDLFFLRLIVPMISKDIQWTQLMVLRDHDAQGFISDQEQFYESVMQRIRTTGETGKRYGVLMTDLRDFEKFNKIAGQAIGDLVLDEMRQRMRTVIRAGDVAALKKYSFRVDNRGSVEILESDETAQKAGDESIFIARTRSLGELVVLGRRLMNAVDDINVYELFEREQARNSDFNAESTYQDLLEAAPYLVRDNHYRLRLSAGVALLQPPTEEELRQPDLLNGYARRAVYHADMAMQDVKELDKLGGPVSIGFRMLDPDLQNGSLYLPGHIPAHNADVIRSMYQAVSKLGESDDSSVDVASLLHEADQKVDSLLRSHLTGVNPANAHTTRIPIGRFRSLRLDER